MTGRVHWIAPALLLALAGCATRPPPKPVDLTQGCLTDIRELPANALGFPPPEAKPPKPRDYSQIAQCVQGEDGSKFAVALFKLQQGVTMPVNLRVVMSETAGGVLAAAVTTLDEQYVAIERIGFERFVNRGTSNTLNVVLNNPATRYVLVSPDNAQVGKSERQYRTQVNSAAIPVGVGAMFVLTTSHADESRRAYSDAGLIAVSLQPGGPLPVQKKK